MVFLQYRNHACDQGESTQLAYGLVSNFESLRRLLDIRFIPTIFTSIFTHIFLSSPSSRINSVESFVSAVEEPDDLIKFDDDMLSPSHFVITSPSLVHKYSQHLGQLECLNWNSPLMIPLEQRKFSITNNLKVCRN